MWGQVISAGASIVGGILGGKPKTETSTSVSGVELADLVSDAEQAGINPLTYIRSGAIGGYVTTKTTGKSSWGGAALGAGIADAGAQIGSLFGSYNTPKNDPIKVRNKTTRAVSTVVGKQLGSTRRAGSVVVAPRLTTVASPTTRTAVVASRGRAPVPGLMPTLPIEKGANRYVRVYDDVTGRQTWGVNPDGPDLEQLIAAGAGSWTDMVYQAFLKSRDHVRERGGLVISRPATASERKAVSESWHGGWLPSIGFKWK